MLFNYQQKSTRRINEINVLRYARRQKLGVDKVDRKKFAEFFKLLSININESEINEIFTTMLDVIIYNCKNNPSHYYELFQIIIIYYYIIIIILLLYYYYILLLLYYYIYI